MITIRKATPDDAPAIISFHQAMAMETEGMECGTAGLRLYMETEGMECGTAGLRLYVEADNVLAQQVYEAMGIDGNHYRTFKWMV